MSAPEALLLAMVVAFIVAVFWVIADWIIELWHEGHGR